MIQNLLPYYKLDTAMTRFTAGPKAPAPEDLAPHQEECFSWGPGGSKRSVLGTWTAQHRNFFGDPHLQAIVHLAGWALSSFLLWLVLRPAWAEYSSLSQLRVEGLCTIQRCLPRQCVILFRWTVPHRRLSCPQALLLQSLTQVYFPL